MTGATQVPKRKALAADESASIGMWRFSNAKCNVAESQGAVTSKSLTTRALVIRNLAAVDISDVCNRRSIRHLSGVDGLKGVAEKVPPLDSGNGRPEALTSCAARSEQSW